jgi:hypothetical protein
LIYGAHTLCFCTLVTILENPVDTFQLKIYMSKLHTYRLEPPFSHSGI